MPKTLMTRLRNDERGQVVVLLAVTLVVLLGSAALVIDVGRAYLAKRHLQSSADAAATAGALELPNPTNAEAYALDYSGRDSAKNDNNKLPSVSTTVTTKCISLAPCNPVNAVVVEQTTVVPTIFAKVLGIDQFTIRAKATACSPCSSKPLDIMLVLDRTGSMCQFSNGSSDPACTDLQNAKAGLLEFVQYMDPSIHKIGFNVFPPRTSSGSSCATPASSNYNSTTAVYNIVPLSTNYKNADGSLNTSSSLVSRINCQTGGGSTAYANAIEQAQAELTGARGRPGVQKVIVMFSDGAANTGPTYYSTTSPYRRQPCHQGITSAGVVKDAGTLIYTIGYDLDAVGGGANICESYTGANESPSILAYDTLRAIATSPDTFYYKPNPGDLTKIYGQIAADIGGTRLVDDNTL
ncbi:MAG TPA: pilus assembly protein TadG-related protein [Gaiellaceae bacterium]|jgi:Flp pilus assembly protein TadG|nr:pilus assembly protein TadG-related protein [Gaiellaceae bacterium]